MFTSLTTNDLIILPFSLMDVQPIFHLSQEASLGEWIPDQVYKDAQQAREVLEFLISQYKLPIDPYIRPFVIGIETKAGHLIGHVGLSPRGDDVEIGYAIGEHYTGKGYATQAVECISKWVTTHLKLSRIIAIVATENIGSAKVLEKAGYNLIAERDMVYLGKIRKCREYELIYRS